MNEINARILDSHIQLFMSTYNIVIIITFYRFSICRFRAKIFQNILKTVFILLSEYGYCSTCQCENFKSSLVFHSSEKCDWTKAQKTNLNHFTEREETRHTKFSYLIKSKQLCGRMLLRCFQSEITQRLITCTFWQSISIFIFYR